MIKLIFDPVLTGHHPEYLHHIYQAASANKCNQYIFVVPDCGFMDLENLYKWEKSDNICFKFLSTDVVQSIHGNLFHQCFRESLLIRKLENEFDPDEIFLIDLAPVIPILPFLLKKAKLSGIIYQIYLWAPKKGIRGLIDKIRYCVMAKTKTIKNIFILNDKTSTKTLNCNYNSTKFKYLPDPVEGDGNYSSIDIRSEYGIQKTDMLFIHFGAMARRKGTLIVLESLLKIRETHNKVFFFAGKIGKDIKDEFRNLQSKILEKGIRLIVKDEFLSYNEIHSLCETADCILIPYTTVTLSSGVLGYASMHNTPVIGPSNGLIGELIKKYDLGHIIPDITPCSLAKEIDCFQNRDITKIYAEEHTIANFVEPLL